MASRTPDLYLAAFLVAAEIAAIDRVERDAAQGGRAYFIFETVEPDELETYRMAYQSGKSLVSAGRFARCIKDTKALLF